jgi:hypothetical protein
MLPAGRVAPAESAAGDPPTAATGPASQEARDPLANQKRLVRKIGAGDVAGVEYELYQDRVYRIRWRLAERFEIPVMDAAVAHLTKEFGKPVYDQSFEAKVGSRKAERRRAGWKQAGLLLELRQLRPLGGGPIFVSLSDLAASQSIIDAQGILMPEPETTEQWWRGPQKPPGLPTADERAAAVVAIDEVVAATVFARTGRQPEPE